MQSLKHYLTKPEVSPPETLLHMLWSLLITVIILYFVAEAVLIAFFADTRTFVQANLIGLYSVLLLVLALDVLATFNRGMYIKGVLKLQRKAVITSYLRFGIYVDLAVLVVLALSFYLPYPWAAFLRLVIIIQLREVFRFDRIFFQTIHTRRNLKQLYLLFKLVLSLMYVNHLLGCLFFYIDFTLIQSSYYGNASLNPLPYWLTNSACFESILIQPATQQYIYSLYFSVSLLTTVAYGDITAKNPIEAMYVIVILLVSTIVISLVLEDVIIILAESTDGFTKFVYFTTSFRKQLAAMLRYMQARNVLYDTRRQVRAYLQFVWYEQNYRDTTAENKIIGRLPREMRKELYKDDYRRYFATIELFGKLPSEIFAEALQSVSQIMLAKNHIVAEPFCSHQLDLFFVERGEINMFYQYDKHSPRKFFNKPHLHRLFNSTTFITGKTGHFGGKAGTGCSILQIQRGLFWELVKQHTCAYETMCYGRDEILLYNNYKLAGDMCFICGSGEHTLLNCNESHFVCKKKSQYPDRQHDRYHIKRLNMKVQPVRKREVKILASDNNRENNMLSSYLNNKWREMQQLRAELQSGQSLRVQSGKVVFAEGVHITQCYYPQRNIEPTPEAE